VEVVAEVQSPAFAEGEGTTREAIPTPTARPIVEVVAEVQAPAFAEGEGTTREAIPTPTARPIVEVVAEVQAPAFAEGEHHGEQSEEETEVLAAAGREK
jgi:hypothetical protein